MARYNTADVSTIAPTIDEIYEALKYDKLYATRDTKAGLALFLLDKHTEQFNFGPVVLDVVHQAQKDGIEFIQHKHYTVPYQSCIYRATIKYDNVDVGATVLTHSMFDDGAACPSKMAVIRAIKCNDGMVFAMRCVNTMNAQLQREGLACEFHLPEDEINYWKPRLGNDQGEMEWQLTEGGLISMGLTMILNTKGVLKERSAPPVKPNKTRAAQGRPLLPYTTRVYTSVYNKAVEKGPVGTHASPRPHLRRAHLRHYPATEHREAYVLPIAAMLVNWDGKPLEARKEYIVK